MTIELSRFYSLFPDEVKELFSFLYQRHIGLAFVGGVTRDFLIKGELSQDVDIQLFFPKHNLQNFFSHWHQVQLELEQKYTLTKHPYEIVSIDVGELSLEFSLARTEVYSQNVHHSNFTPEFSPEEASETSLKRRDFTMNAIVFSFYEQEIKVIDPFKGKADIQNKRLHPISADFCHDPVRFLRAMRFRETMGFVFSDELSDYLQKMPLGKLSRYYILKEFMKTTNFFMTLNKAMTLRPDGFEEELMAFGKFAKLITIKLSTPEDLVVFLREQGATKAEMTGFLTYFSLGIKKYKHLL
jgi:tRNA nucleotidyltransferase/poly(A) polymerase